MTATNTHTAQARPIALDPTPPPDDEAQALARYERLATDERLRAARLVMISGCSLAQAVSAIVALRKEPN